MKKSKDDPNQIGSPKFSSQEENSTTFDGGASEDSSVDERSDGFLEDGESSAEVDIQTIAWFKKMSDEHVSESVRDEFNEWYVEDPERQKVFEELSYVWEHPYFEYCLRKAKEKADKAAAEKERWWAGAAAPNWLLVFSAGAALVASLLIVVILPLNQTSSPVQRQKVYYQTAVGEQRTLRLIDGTTVSLNTNTRILVEFERYIRSVTVVQGEVYFDVVKEEGGRPFEVVGGTGLARVLGTAFEVRVNEGRMVVSVERGRVAVSPENNSIQGIELTPRQRVAVNNRKLDDIEGSVEAVADWRDGTLGFQGVVLSEVIEELRKYHVGNITLADQSLSLIRVYGVYNIKNVQEAIKRLTAERKLDYTATNGDIMIFDPKNVKSGFEGKAPVGLRR